MKNKQNEQQRAQAEKGSILAYSLIVIFMMLAIVSSMSVVGMLERTGVDSSQSSAQAFQVADSGAELAIEKINAVLRIYPGDSINDAFGASVCNDSTGVATIANNVDQGAMMPYDISFYAQDGSTPITSCSAEVNTIKNVKSIGTYKNTVRAVEVNVGDSFTKLLLHADGTNGSTTFIDSENAPKTVTANNGARISTNSPKFGSGSANFDGVDDYLSLADSDDWSFGTGDFTVDFWEKSSDSSRQHAFSFGGTSATNLDFDFNDPASCGGSAAGLWVYWNSSGSTKICSSGGANAYTDGGWHHIALVRQSNTITLYVDGSSVGNATYNSAINVTGSNTNIIGAWNGGGYYWNGNLDEIRISKGIARWTSNFTPPTGAY